MIQALKQHFRDIRNSLSWSSEDEAFSKQMQVLVNFESSQAKKFLVQLSPDYFYFTNLATFLHAYSLETQNQVNIGWLWPFAKSRTRKGLKSWVIDDLIKGPLHKRKWCRYAKALGGEVEFSFDLGQSELEKWNKKTNEVLGSFQKPEDLENFTVNGVLIGDLIYDTYLRYANRPTVDFDSPFLFELLRQSLAVFESFEEYLSKNQVDGLVTAYSTYTTSGIPARLALKKGIAVYILAPRGQLLCQLEPDFAFHTRNFHKYRSWFESLSEGEKKEGIELGHRSLKARLSGERDPAIWYMKASAYSKSASSSDLSMLPAKKRKTVLVISHDFFDSPHIYGKMIFPDFYIWMDEVLRFYSDLDFEVIVKPHPNAILGNQIIYDEFKHKYPRTHFVPSSTSSLALVERGVDLVLTVYGTVAHELAYLGAPVLCAGENPHSSFQFCQTEVDRTRYFDLLAHPERVPRPQKESDEVAAFYFVHNFRAIRDQIPFPPQSINSAEARQWLLPSHPKFESRVEVYRHEIRCPFQM